MALSLSLLMLEISAYIDMQITATNAIMTMNCIEPSPLNILDPCNNPSIIEIMIMTESEPRIVGALPDSTPTSLGRYLMAIMEISMQNGMLK